LQLEAGDVLIQPTLDTHLDRPTASRRLDIIRLPWKRETSLGGVYRGVDTQTIERVAMRDVYEAAQLLAQALGGRSAVAPVVLDWEDKLASALAQTKALRIAGWAQTNNRTREYAWRCFRSEYGVAPKRFHGELRARAAWLAVTGSRDRLSDIAAKYGFADQAHMTRAIHAFTGCAPTAWRRRLHTDA
jgi:AraC-like DNA-binding protein